MFKYLADKLEQYACDYHPSHQHSLLHSEREIHLTCWQIQFPYSFITQITYNPGKCQVSTLLKGKHSS